MKKIYLLNSCFNFNEKYIKKKNNYKRSLSIEKKNVLKQRIEKEKKIKEEKILF